MARFTVSIDDGLKDRLDGFAEAKGYNRSEALEVMIRAFFEAPAEGLEPASVEPVLPAATAPDSALVPVVSRSSPEDDWRAAIARLEAFVTAQQAYVKDLHDVLAANTDVCREAFSNLGLSYDFFVTSVEPPKADWNELGG